MKRKSGFIVAVVLAALLYPGSGADAMGQENAGAGDMYSRGMAYYRSGGYPKALDLFRPAAEQGYPGAQNVIGVMYANGEGVTQSYTEALKWYRKAAEQGIAGAQCNLGNLYCKGEGVVQDYAEAAQWWRKAAEQGFAEALYNLGFLYEHGVGVSKNIEKAKECYRKAVSQGYFAAEEDLRRIAEEERSARTETTVTTGYNPPVATGLRKQTTADAPAGKGQVYYQNMYNIWARRAESNYRSLTNLGIRLKNKHTNERAGSTGQSMNSGNYVVMKKNLREAQNQMRNIRQQASRAGVTIPQSVWETATVSY